MDVVVIQENKIPPKVSQNDIVSGMEKFSFWSSKNIGGKY
jgi:hypothetical protein